VKLEDPGETRFALNGADGYAQPVPVVVSLCDQVLIRVMYEGEGNMHLFTAGMLPGSELLAIYCLASAHGGPMNLH
jgi:hypothetical protein